MESATLLRRLLWFVLYAAAAVFALYLFVRPPGMDALSRARFGDAIYGRAWRPFVTRALLPWTVRAITIATPAAIRERVSGSVRARIVRNGEPQHVNEYPYEFAVTLVLLFACLVGFAFSLRRLARVTLGLTGWRLDLIPVPALLFLPCFYVRTSFIYDFPTLFLFTLGLVMLAERRWVGYFVVFAIACLNKETTLLLTVVWLVNLWNELPRRKLLLGAAAQVLFLLAVRGGLALLYADNPGTPLEWHLWRNLDRCSHIDYYLLTRPASSLLREFGPKALAVLGFAGVIASWKNGPRFLKDAFWIIVPLLLLSLLFGFLEEARDYYEFYPVGILLLARPLLGLSFPAKPT